MEDYISVQEAADLLCVRPQTVRKHLARGKLTGTKVKGAWVVASESVRRRLFGDVCKGGGGETRNKKRVQRFRLSRYVPEV